MAGAGSVGSGSAAWRTELLDRVTSPVLLLRPSDTPPRFERILVAVDDSAASEKALEVSVAAGLLKEGSRITLAEVAEPAGHERAGKRDTLQQLEPLHEIRAATMSDSTAPGRPFGRLPASRQRRRGGARHRPPARADARVVESTALQTAEAALTGESLPVSKDTAPIADEVALGDRHNMVFSGTAATYGRGRAVVDRDRHADRDGPHRRHAAADAPSEATPLQRSSIAPASCSASSSSSSPS